MCIDDLVSISSSRFVRFNVGCNTLANKFVSRLDLAIYICFVLESIVTNIFWNFLGRINLKKTKRAIKLPELLYPVDYFMEFPLQI